MAKLPHIIKPCRDCPFRKDTLKGWLGERRMREIVHADSFACHKTLGDQATRMQCAGHMLVKGDSNTFVQLASRLDIPLELSGDELVFDTTGACIQHHAN